MEKNEAALFRRILTVLNRTWYSTSYVTGMGSLYRRNEYREKFHADPPHWLSKIEAGMVVEILGMAIQRSTPLPKDMQIPPHAEQWTNRRNDEIREYKRAFGKNVPEWIYELSKREALDLLTDAISKGIPLKQSKRRGYVRKRAKT